MDLTEKTNPILSSDYPSNKLSNHREHGCNFQKLGTKGEILPNHRDYPCILLHLEINNLMLFAMSSNIFFLYFLLMTRRQR
ncbi:hypothetical protein Hanom_Chr05g00422051 [Helianthus anomalus]